MVDFKELRKKNLDLTRKAVHRSVSRDLLIVQAVNFYEELAGICNITVNRLREWYGFYNPEFSRRVYSNEDFVRQVSSAARPKESMGAVLGKADLAVILGLAEQAVSLYDFRQEILEYLEKAMKDVCPNLQAVAGTLVGAQLLAFAGSLKNLSEMPSSTVQLLGAEKALFRHLHGQGKSPKHGVLVNHELVKSAQHKEKGKVARALADKITIAVKVDYFKGEFIGDKLRQELEKRFAK